MSGTWPFWTMVATCLSMSFQLMTWTSTLMFGLAAWNSSTTDFQNLSPALSAPGPSP
jgi:hypothetical protein